MSAQITMSYSSCHISSVGWLLVAFDTQLQLQPSCGVRRRARAADGGDPYAGRVGSLEHEVDVAEVGAARVDVVGEVRGSQQRDVAEDHRGVGVIRRVGSVLGTDVASCIQEEDVDVLVLVVAVEQVDAVQLDRATWNAEEANHLLRRGDDIVVGEDGGVGRQRHIDDVSYWKPVEV